MFLAILKKNTNVSAEAKLVHACFSLRFQEFKAPAMRLDDLAGQLKISLRLLSAGIKELEQAGLIDSTVVSSGKGRPKHSYMCNSDALAKLPVVGSFEEIHIPAVEKFLGSRDIGVARVPVVDGESTAASKENEVGERLRRGRLDFFDAGNKLLVVVLLAGADRLGVVRGWSHTQLAAVIGLSVISIKGRLKKLVGLGVIRKVVPGCGSPIFKSRQKTVYLLNLNHRIFAGSDCVSEVLIHHLTFVDHGNDFRLIQRLYDEARGKVMTPQSPHSVLSLCRRVPKHAFEQLEFMLHEVASAAFMQLALNRPLTKLQMKEVQDFAADRIAEFIRRPTGSSSQENDLIAEVIEHLAFLVFLMTDELTIRLRAHVSGVLVGAGCLVMPGCIETGYQSIALLLYGAGRDKKCLVINESRSDHEIIEFEAEEEVPIEQRKRACLISAACSG